MNRKLIPFLVGSLFAATAASAADEDQLDWSGSSVSIGVRNTTQEGGKRNGAFVEPAVLPDLNGRDRVLAAVKPDGR